MFGEDRGGDDLTHKAFHVLVAVINVFTVYMCNLHKLPYNIYIYIYSIQKGMVGVFNFTQPYKLC